MSFTSPEQTWASATSAAFPDATDRATALPSVIPAQVPSSAERRPRNRCRRLSPESLPPPVADDCPCGGTLARIALPAVTAATGQSDCGDQTRDDDGACAHEILHVNFPLR